ncbi:hypothetical protein FG386_001316 [Cryptosporidium ryanae]|uniref:uncharacterized protein n=1 Tax=Cryptosporidium ryanae TaxID=515981 RepID=UPI003519EDEA|nr:hypothetical protein FG386_001316 [Cryptosporidium ryanae]
MYTTISRIFLALVFPFTGEFWKMYGMPFVISSVFLIISWYYFVYTYKLDPNKMKCVYQYVSSLILSLICWPIVFDLWSKYFMFGMNIEKWLNYESYNYSSYLLSIFLSSLILDLIFGVIYFKKHMFILNGWFHHSVYIIFTLYILKWKAYNMFLLAAPEEIPTYFISIYVIFPQNYKKFSEMMFCITFFIFRIAYHIAGYSFLFLSKENREATQLWIPTSITILAHCYWYLLWLRKHWTSIFHPSYIPSNSSMEKINEEQTCIDYFDHYSKIEQEV